MPLIFNKVKYIRIFLLCIISVFLLVSCKEDDLVEDTVEETENVSPLAYLNDYDVLKSYVNREASSDFKLGAGVSIGTFNKLDIDYNNIVANFDEVTAGYGMKHGAVVQNNGSMNFSSVAAFINTAEQAGETIYGHTLTWHANQNATYLKGIIAPVEHPEAGDSLAWQTLTEINFESDNEASYLGNSNAEMSFTAADEGAIGEGRALKVTNAEVRENDWNTQLFVTFDPATETGQHFRLTMDVKADVDVSYSTQAHVVPYEYKHWDFFGTINATTDWQTITVDITIADNTSCCTAIAFDLGSTATTYYFDNISVERYNPEDGGEIQAVEMTPEDKKDTITAELDRWIAGIMGVAKNYVHAWDVVNEPMDDGNPYELKSGVGRNDLSADHFYWQDYMGKDYAVQAFKMAAQYGNAKDKLFINDYNLESNIDKCRGLIAYVEYIESQGARVDGIGTQMHISTNSNKEKIVEMFELLAATGKLIKISELDIGIEDGVKTTDATADDLKAQSEMYKYVVEKYLEIIPEAQQYGITAWSPLDSSVDSYWRAGQPIGLWTIGYNRKPAYAGFADGLSGE